MLLAGLVTLRRAGLADRDAIWRVQTAAIREGCSAHYAPEQIEAWAGRLRPESYDEILCRREVMVACRGGEVVGFGQLNVGAAEIEAVYVAPGHLRCGVGSLLLERLEEIARERGLRALRLCATLNALPFYRKNGYASVGNTVMRVNAETALTCVAMWKELGRALHEIQVGPGF